MEPTLENTTTTTGQTPEAPIQEQRTEKTSLVDQIARQAFPDEFKQPDKPAEKPVEAPVAQKPEEVVKPEPQDNPDALPSEIKSPKAAENFRRIRAERDELRKQIEELKKTPAPKSAEPSTELEALRKERDQYSEQLRILGIEKHPKFEAHYAGRTAAVIDSVKHAIGGEQGEVIAKILAQPDSASRKAQLSELAATLDPVDASQLGAALLDLRKISGERAAEIERAKSDFSRFQEAQKLQQQQRNEQLNKVFDAELSKAQDPKHDGLEFLQTREGDEEWNGGVKQLIEHARNIFNGQLTEAEAARAAQMAAVAPLYKRVVAAQSTEIANLKAEIKSLKSATPAPGSGADPVQQQRPKFKNSIEAIVAMAENDGFVKKTP